MYSFSVEDHCRRSSSHISLSRPTSPTLSSTGTSIDSQPKRDALCTPPCPSTLVSFHDARKIISSGQKVLQEWNRQWESLANFLFRAVNAFLELGLIKLPVDRARGELMTMIQNGRRALVQLESIAYCMLISSQSWLVNSQICG